ncbi:cysteine--tRNA ligase [Chengkuizengella axinellae]|uniref:Cysteine--tRNA ligase n=1 Tax=Chengkuizengella axinellae TaxID=3064388 RepID=A0ABT9J5H9_9BACL|nr:cysteine--tRNA ligase [Chengkuizengella sp. 2205SS18-9]MDP5276860.1 cysteine--tRNA ligase [Chengkuizengella sp. 2205SS18-9]
MALKVFNTLTRKKEDFKPIESGKVKMYVCGPTVYGYIHIGNARPLIFFDVVRKYLEALNYEVEYIINFTDVDDKIIKKANEMNRTVTEVADQFIEAYLDDSKHLLVKPATIYPRVTENMKEIIEFITKLVDGGYAYANDGDVFYRTGEFKDYGKLSHQNLEELQFGKRIEVDDRKENPQDFVLWKKAKPGEVFWESPWGDGRPGWHIECSTMAKKYLGETMDIHGGGQDLQFPHHECEIAQSEVVNHTPLANYWLHNGYVNINNEKMSKSLGNGVNVKQLLKNYKAEVIRYFILSTHYSNPLNFSGEVMEQAKQSLARIQNCISNLDYRLENVSNHSESQQDVEQKVALILETFHKRMQDDFNTADAITSIFDLVTETNQYLQNDKVDSNILGKMKSVFQEMNTILGLIKDENNELLDEEVENLIQERVNARKNKNWARADEIRDELQQQGILLEDTPQGMRWKRK